jgi:hypothetical protein
MEPFQGFAKGSIPLWRIFRFIFCFPLSGPSENPLIPLLFHFGRFFVPTANGTKFNGPADGRSNEITLKVTHFSVAIIGHTQHIIQLIIDEQNS